LAARVYVYLLQLVVAVFFAGAFVVIGMLSSSVWQQALDRNGAKGRNKRTPRDASASEDATNKDTARDLLLVLGCRPNVGQIIHEMKDWCDANSVSTVGVSACGPNRPSSIMWGVLARSPHHHLRFNLFWTSSRLNGDHSHWTPHCIFNLASIFETRTSNYETLHTYH
jgi:hypothetical protein